ATPALYLFGGGHVSLAISRIAEIAGFETIVADDREAFANRQRFPQASQFYSGPWEQIFPRLHPNGFSYLVIATRGHSGDLTCLRWAVASGARYVSMIGSRRKLIEFFKVLEREGVPEEKLACVHSPAGLEIGALTPEEIAVSVVAEMIAVRRNAAASASSMSFRPKARHAS
ncbi:MAG: XdhC family protein, partial [Terriglobia bacterium]